jgi:hypothetical protein
MLAAYFCHSCLSKWRILVHLKKWIGWMFVLHKEWLALYWSSSSGNDVKFARSSNHWEARVIPEEMSQTLLTYKKQGNLD